MRSFYILSLISLAIFALANDSQLFKRSIGATTRNINVVKKPPITFWLSAKLPKSAGVGGVVSPYAGLFYFGTGYFPFCDDEDQTPCTTGKKPKPVFALYKIVGDQSFLGLNTSTRYPNPPGSSKISAQELFIAITGELRFMKPPQEFIQGNELQEGFRIVKGSNGKPDTLHFTGPFGPAPFYSCLIDKTDGISQIYIGIPEFKQTGCTQFVPQVHYSTQGVFEWE